MRMINFLVMGSLVACSAGNQKSIDAKVAENETDIFSLGGSSAEILFDALHVGAIRKGFGSVKSAVAVNLICAKKVVSSASSFECSAEQLVFSGQSSELTPLFFVQGVPAESLYGALSTVGKRRGFGSVKAVDGEVDIRCQANVQGTVTTHSCAAVSSI